jgi:hypothetical protein
MLYFYPILLQKTYKKCLTIKYCHAIIRDVRGTKEALEIKERETAKEGERWKA